MDTIPTAALDPYGDQLRALAASLEPTHLVTLNTHRTTTLGHAVGLLQRWRVEVLRRLCGRRFFTKSVGELVEFIAFPELGSARCPHFHLMTRIPEGLRAAFAAIASERWKSLAPSGTFNLRVIDRSAESMQRLLGYVTKELDPKGEHPFVDGRVTPGGRA